MSGEWRQFVMNLESLAADRVEAVLMSNGAHAVTLSDAGDDPVLEPAPGQTPLWNSTRVTALFDADTNFDALAHDLQDTFGLAQLPPNHIEVLADRAWEREWLKDFGPMKFGRRLWIVPGEAEQPEGDVTVVRLDPGLAFGTGTHPTTALCLEWLDAIDVRGKTVFDFGCGSGVLSVAACKLGAASVEGVDIDMQAVTASRQNAERNHVGDRFTASQTFAHRDKTFDIVIANILAGTLVEHAEFLTAIVRQGGSIALSGILADQVPEVQTAFRDAFELEHPSLIENWALLSGKRH